MDMDNPSGQLMATNLDTDLGSRFPQFHAAGCREIPSCSVIIPIYNRHEWLETCLQSIARSHANPSQIEVLVIDDGSLDQHKERIHAIAAAYQCHYQRLPFNQGVSAARNAGLARARASLVKFLDSDDQLVAGSLQKEISIMEATRVDCLVSGYLVRQEVRGKQSLHFHPPRPYTNTNPFDALLSGFGAPTPSVLYRRSILANVRWSATIRHPDDWVFIITVLKQLPRLLTWQEPTFIWCNHDGPRQSNVPLLEYCRSRQLILEDIWAFILKHGAATSQRAHCQCDCIFRDIIIAYREDQDLYNSILKRIESLYPGFVPSVRQAGFIPVVLVRVFGLRRYVPIREHLRALALVLIAPFTPQVWAWITPAAESGPRPATPHRRKTRPPGPG
jgi:glycosyltransferase involved in cell wall biosynthesis